MIGVLELGMGNPASVHNMLRTLGVPTTSITEPGQIHEVGGLVLPGVGHYDHGMAALGSWVNPLRSLVGRGVPMLGICLGMQLLFEGSDEGTSPGLSILPGRLERVSQRRPGVRVPHVGWADVRPVHPNLLLPEPGEFYFTHSYCLAADADPVVAVCDYGDQPIAAVVAQGHVWGVQFHPEKSHRFGKGLLRRFWEDICLAPD